MTNRQTTRDLAEQLNQLRIAIENLQVTLNRLEEEEETAEARDHGPQQTQKSETETTESYTTATQ